MATGPSLRDCLCRDDAQRFIILKGAEALHILGPKQAPGRDLIGVAETFQSGKKGTASAMQLYLRDDKNKKENKDNNRLDRVAGYLQTVANEPVDDITRSWCVIMVLALFPESRKQVMRATERRLGAYFYGGNGVLPFDQRLCEKLCGTKLRQALTPVEIVISEWQLYSKLDGCVAQ